MSRLQQSRVAFAGAAVALVLCAGALLPLLADRTNCGGNSAALAACSGYIAVLRVWQADHDDEPLHYDQTDSETRQHLRRLPGASWIRSARLLARLDEVRIDSSAARRIIMVCDQAYDNVPQRSFGRRSAMAHAVAYSTGETGLISSQEFARLNLGGFVKSAVCRGPTRRYGERETGDPFTDELNFIGSWLKSLTLRFGAVKNGLYFDQLDAAGYRELDCTPLVSAILIVLPNSANNSQMST